MRILIAAVLLCFSCNISYAKYCVKLPTCEELGYVFAANSTRRQILCPFDTDYALYLDYCQAYGLSAKPDGDAGDYQECVETKKDGTQINSGYYRYIRCNPGYTYNSGNCIANTCDGFNSATNEIANCAIIGECQKGKDKVYKCDECAENYEFNESGTECFKSCLFTETTPIANCADTPCYKGATPYYDSKCTTCAEGYELDEYGICKLPRPEVGDIYYYEETAIGVVFYSDASTTKIIALTDINKDGNSSSSKLYWSTAASSTYIYETGNSYCTTSCTNDIDGKRNTSTILSYISSTGYTSQAATATSLYAPDACTLGTYCGKGEWYLPSMGELQLVYNKLTTIQNAINTVNGTPISTETYYWSSTESSKDKAWRIGFSNGGNGTPIKSNTFYVRPALTICADGYVLDKYGVCIPPKSTYNIGDIYYHKDVPIGVVFFEEGGTTKIVALKDINANGAENSATSIYWTSDDSSDYVDIPNVLTTTKEEEVLGNINGKLNTQYIIEYSLTNGYGYKAADATQKYTPSVCADIAASNLYCGKGAWYLPAMGELNAIYNNLSTIQTSISNAGGTQISTNSYWSSTEASDSYAWYLTFSNGNRWYNLKHIGHYIRPILEISNTNT